MSLRTKFMSSLAITGLVLGISGGLLFALEPTNKAEHGRPTIMAQLSPDRDLSYPSFDLIITDVSIHGNLLTLRGHRRDGNDSVSVVIKIPTTQNIADAEALVRRRFDFNDGH